MRIVKEGFKSVYEPDVQRLARILLGIESDVETFKALLPRTSKIPKQHREERGLADVMGYTSENIYVFYQVTDVHACAIPIGIRLFIEIPLKYKFRPQLLPYYDDEIDEIVIIII